MFDYFSCFRESSRVEMYLQEGCAQILSVHDVTWRTPPQQEGGWNYKQCCVCYGFKSHPLLSKTTDKMQYKSFFLVGKRVHVSGYPSCAQVRGWEHSWTNSSSPQSIQSLLSPGLNQEPSPCQPGSIYVELPPPTNTTTTTTL